jgi:hypothetical protein
LRRPETEVDGGAPNFAIVLVNTRTLHTTDFVF